MEFGDEIDAKPHGFGVACDTSVTDDELRSCAFGVCFDSGIMVKYLDVEAGYTPSKRSDSWLKVKRDYVEGLNDSLILGQNNGTCTGQVLSVTIIDLDCLVLLGRSTGDVDVDIDLRKEGRANKISRRQATIKMETNGSFFLKNLGKSSISVNGKAVGSEQSMHLSSSCLIELQEVPALGSFNPEKGELVLA
ncbi:hypothetical protein POM88_052851 [Heracleum sosnowskyi]|uniref:FHA domain-containing protein n=1 Tax=Heracleum sosnowskyi TaxID=360622 RepID=A0AAD8LYE7_9APIA|nr:hypothetical protein POM88_052851 [Heracleum sosnowskyi]